MATIDTMRNKLDEINGFAVGFVIGEEKDFANFYQELETWLDDVEEEGQVSVIKLDERSSNHGKRYIFRANTIHEEVLFEITLEDGEFERELTVEIPNSRKYKLTGEKYVF